MTDPVQRLNPVYSGIPVSIFERMSRLARELDAINLGQGFPDEPVPSALAEAVARATRERSNQYPPMAGVPELRDAVARFYARTQRLVLTPEQLVVTSGATEAIAAAVLAIVNPGDEVIVSAPAYDAYAPLVRRAGGVPVFVPLRPPHWRYVEQDIAAAIGPRTRAIVLNDPLNPLGTVAGADDLAMLARLCVEHDLIAICDEVWEAVRFDGRAHRSLLDLPGMAQRAVKIGSAGKIFGVTGWKVGWLAAAPDLAAVLARAHQYLSYATPPMLQWAVADALDRPEIAKAQHDGWAVSRARLRQRLDAAGFQSLANDATWFSCIDLAASGISLGDRDFAERAVREASVATIPLSALWEGEGCPTGIVRLCHCKPLATLDEAVDRLAAWRDSI